MNDRSYDGLSPTVKHSYGPEVSRDKFDDSPQVVDYGPEVVPGFGQPGQGQAPGAGYYADHDGQKQYGHGQYGQSQYDQSQYGQNQYGHGQYGQDQYGQDQYGHDQHRDPSHGRKRRILGLPVVWFWVLVVGLVLAVGVGLGVGLGIGLKSGQSESEKGATGDNDGGKGGGAGAGAGVTTSPSLSISSAASSVSVSSTVASATASSIESLVSSAIPTGIPDEIADPVPDDEDPTTTPSDEPSATADAPVTAGTTGLSDNSCTFRNPRTYGGPHDSSFTQYCFTDWPNNGDADDGSGGTVTDLARRIVYTFEDCMDACADYNEDLSSLSSSRPRCKAVTYNSNLTSILAEGRQGGNCFLKDKKGVDRQGRAESACAALVE